MTRALWSLVVIAATLALQTDAIACSAGPGHDRRAATDVFVLGTITGVKLDTVALTSVPGQNAPPPTVRATVTMSVDHVLKGTAPRSLTFTDLGNGDGCSAFPSDASAFVGSYAAIALLRDDAGALHATRLLGAVFAPGIGDARVAALVLDHGLQLPTTSTVR